MSNSIQAVLEAEPEVAAAEVEPAVEIVAEAVPEPGIAAAPVTLVEAVETVETAAEQADEDLGSAADTVIDTVTAGQQQALQSFESASVAMLASVARVQREVADFVSERIRQDVETQQALLRCKSLDEFRDVQAQFFRLAVDQYARGASRMMKIGGETMQRSFERA